MKKIMLLIAAAAAVFVLLGRGHAPAPDRQEFQAVPADGLEGSAVDQAFEKHRSGVQVTGRGTVARLLSEDDSGSRHQRFILRLPSGHTLLVAHNIDLAPEVPDLNVGDEVSFSGEYEWNGKGGVLHWTHHDPRSMHSGGWLEHDGQRYQ